MPIGIQGPTVALTDIRDEFALGSSDPISLSEFYGGGSYISANVATYWGIPTSGIIDISDFISTYAMANASVVIAELKTMGNTSLGGADAYSINNYLWSDLYSMADGKGNYTSAPTVEFEDSGIIRALGTSTLLADQVNSITISNGGYGYEEPPIITFSGGNGSGAVAEAILGGEKISGQNGASWRILSINYDTQFRNDTF